MRAHDLLTLTDEGLYCPAGNFHIDPWKAVDQALITHGHADHARAGSQRYLTADPGAGILKTRLGKGVTVETQAYGERRTIGGVRVSFHPAGHVLGSAQIRVEHRGEVWVAAGDYKVEDDGISGSFEPVRCDTFITESTFGLPVYRWRPQADVMDEIRTWWAANQRAERASVIFAYALGKAQRILHALDGELGPIFVHGAIAKLLPAFEAEGITFPELESVTDSPPRALTKQALILAPPSADNTPWLRRFGPHATAFASGWMRIRGSRRRRHFDRGFVLSDHVDWPGLLHAIDASEATRVLVTHGYSAAVVRHLRDKGREADTLETRFEGDSTE